MHERKRIRNFSSVGGFLNIRFFFVCVIIFDHFFKYQDINSCPWIISFKKITNTRQHSNCWLWLYVDERARHGHMSKICTRSKTSGTQWQNHSNIRWNDKNVWKSAWLENLHIFYAWCCLAYRLLVGLSDSLSAHLHRQWSHCTLFVCIQCIIFAQCSQNDWNRALIIPSYIVHVVPPVLNLEYLFLICSFFISPSIFYGFFISFLFFASPLLHNIFFLCFSSSSSLLLRCIHCKMLNGYNTVLMSVQVQLTSNRQNSQQLNAPYYTFATVFHSLFYYIFYSYSNRRSRSQWEYGKDRLSWTHQTPNSKYFNVTFFFMIWNREMKEWKM